MNRITLALDGVAMGRRAMVTKKLKETTFKPVDLAPAFLTVYKKSKDQGIVLAEAYAETIKNPEEHRELFQRVSLMKETERKAFITVYQNAGQGKGVVHAISQLPRGQAHLLMGDLLLKTNSKKSIDKQGAQGVLIWLREAGKTSRKLENDGRHTPADPDVDSAVVEFFEDIADAIADAIDAIVDAIEEIIDSIGDLLHEIADWTRAAVSALCQALVAAANTVAEVLQYAVESGFQILKKMVQGIQDIGRSLFNILEEAFTLVVNS